MGEIKMAEFSFDEIVNAYLYVSSAPYGTNSAYLNVKTGKISYQSEMMGITEGDDNEMDWDQMIEVPHKNDLGLGQSLVFEFVEVNLPDAYREVRDMFRRKGAYSRFKGLLESKDMLETWYSFENEREQEALRSWCEESQIPLSD